MHSLKDQVAIIFYKNKHPVKTFLKNKTQRPEYAPNYPNYDPHALALWSEGKDLQNIVGQDMSARGLQLHWGQVPTDQCQTHTLCPLHQGNLTGEEKDKREMFKCECSIILLYKLGESQTTVATVKV